MLYIHVNIFYQHAIMKLHDLYKCKCNKDLHSFYAFLVSVS